MKPPSVSDFREQLRQRAFDDFRAGHRGWHSLLQAVCVAPETGSRLSISSHGNILIPRGFQVSNAFGTQFFQTCATFVATFARTWGFRWFAHVLANVATQTTPARSSLVILGVQFPNVGLQLPQLLSQLPTLPPPLPTLRHQLPTLDPQLPALSVRLPPLDARLPQLRNQLLLVSGQLPTLGR